MLKNTLIKTTILLVLMALIHCSDMTAQIELELIINTNETNKDEFIFIPGSRTSLILNKCGNIIHKWEHDTSAGLTGRLTHDGYLLRAGKISGCCFQASNGGLIELLEYDGTVHWSYEFANDSIQQHHDLQYLPNGNIIFLGWEVVDREERIALGKAEIDSPLWSEFVYEIKPIGTDTFDLVWEWHLKDHLIQDIDSTKSNYAEIANSLGKVNINFLGQHAFSTRDWWHANALDYNMERNEILVNSRANGETWIIDHSTTSIEAKGNSGGNRGKGGQLLFRWGNPATHNAGNPDAKLQYGSHGHNWIKAGLPNAGKILFFNNGSRRPGSDRYSTIEMIQPAYDSSSNYVVENSKFKLLDHQVIYGENPSERFYSAYRSNAEQLPSGGFLINAANAGKLFEINTENEIIWETKGRLGFKAHMYPVNYSGFINQNIFEYSIGTTTKEYLCANTLILNPNIISDSILWSTGETSLTIEITSAGRYYYDIQDSCDTVVRHFIDVENFPQPEETFTTEYLCGDTPLTLVTNIESNNILWSTGETSSTIIVSSPGVYFYHVDTCGFIVRHEIEVMSIPPLVGTLNVNQGEDIIIDLIDFNDTLFQEVFWYESENSSEILRSGRYFGLPGTQNDTILWVAQGPSPDCLSERYPIHIDVKSTAIDEISNNSPIRVYPNPAKGELFIDSHSQEKYSFQFMDLNGKIILASDQRQLNLKGLAPGCYFLSIINEGGRLIHSEKIIKLE